MNTQLPVLYSESQNTFLADQSGSKSQFVSAVSGILDQLVGARRGKIFTGAINAAGLAEDPAELQRYYEQNSAVIDGYFQRVDMVKMAEYIGGDAGSSISKEVRDWLERAPAFAFGAVLGGGVVFMLGRKGIFLAGAAALLAGGYKSLSNKK